MSTQADKIKAFRLAQHARIQKEEEDEWISGEELCTEGSSDEETTNKSTCGHKKNKKPDKVGISPLALPKKNNRSDGNETQTSIALPSIDDNNKIVSLNTCDEDEAIAKISLEESLKINADVDFCMQWRPKRGSLKLPTVSEGQSFYNMAHETNLFHRDMLINLKNMRHKFTVRKLCDEKDALDLERMRTFRFKQKILSDIDRRDEEINRLDEIVEGMKKERLKIHGDNEEFESECENENQRQSQVFTNFCQLEIAGDANNDNFNENLTEDKKDDNDVTENDTGTQKETKNKRFIERNIELSKHGRMATLSLTDEEKMKLDELLSDIDLQEGVTDANVSDNSDNPEQLAIMTDLDIDKIPENTKTSANPYRLEVDEEKRLNEMEIKMKEFLNSEPDDEVGRKILEENDKNVFDKYYESGKLWKCQLINKRLKEIDKELTLIAENKAQEQMVDFEREIKIQYEIGDNPDAVEKNEECLEK